MKKLVLICLLSVGAFTAPAFAHDYDHYNSSRGYNNYNSSNDYNTSDDHYMVRNSYERPYHNNVSLSASLATARWEEMRPVERRNLVRAQIHNWDSLPESQKGNAYKKTEYNWKKMSVTERKDLIMEWQRTHPHNMGPMNDRLEDKD